MQLTYGGYTHALNENLVSVRYENIANAQGIQHARRQTWDIQGKLIGATRAALVSNLNSLKNGYAGRASGTATFKYDDGTVAHQMLDGEAIGGVRVTRGPEFPADLRAYVSYIPYAITIEGVFPERLVRFLSFSESVTFEGGGPAFAHVTVVEGPPVKHKIADQTPYRATQSGRIVGQFGYPVIPPPIWPQALIRAPIRRPDSPRRSGNGLSEYPIDYEYNFESAAPLIGVPTLPPNE